MNMCLSTAINKMLNTFTVKHNKKAVANDMRPPF